MFWFYFMRSIFFSKPDIFEKSRLWVHILFKMQVLMDSNISNILTIQENDTSSKNLQLCRRYINNENCAADAFYAIALKKFRKYCPVRSERYFLQQNPHSIIFSSIYLKGSPNKTISQFLLLIRSVSFAFFGST